MFVRGIIKFGEFFDKPLWEQKLMLMSMEMELKEEYEIRKAQATVKK